jgi:hypothetical protein
MAEERADLRQAKGERIARREARAHIGRVRVGRGEAGAVDRGQNFALDRQPRPQPLDIGPAPRGTLEMENESLRSAQDWPILQRPDMRRGSASGL